VTINEPNIQMLMGWIEGATPPGRRRAFADAYCVLDNLLTAHVLAFDAIAAVQPEAEVTCNTSSSSIYEHDRLLTDLFLLRVSGVAEKDVDFYVDERRVLHDAVFPPQHAGEFMLRRFFAAVSPYGTPKSVGRGGMTRSPATRSACPGGGTKGVSATGQSDALSGTCRRTPKDCDRGVGPNRLCTPVFPSGWWRTGWPPRVTRRGPMGGIGRAI
jgi:hypothetical protein